MHFFSLTASITSDVLNCGDGVAPLRLHAAQPIAQERFCERAPPRLRQEAASRSRQAKLPLCLELRLGFRDSVLLALELSAGKMSRHLADEFVVVAAEARSPI